MRKFKLFIFGLIGLVGLVFIIGFISGKEIEIEDNNPLCGDSFFVTTDLNFDLILFSVISIALIDINVKFYIGLKYLGLQ